MNNFKIPIYAGIVGFVLIMITNFVKGNSIFVVFFRSFFYGILVFSLVLGIYFILKKFLNIDFNINNTKPDIEDEEKKANVDILVGNDDVTEEDENVTFNENENINIEKEVNPIEDFAIKEEKENTIDNFDDGINEVLPEKKIFEVNDDLIDDTGDEDKPEENKSNEFDDLGLEENNFQEKEDYSKKNSKEDILKKKIGIDVSYDELAKAIRTKIKRDE